MSFADHFSSIAKHYAAFRPHYPAALVDALRARTTGDVAWDIGCGSGQLTLALADKFARVIATDPAQAQIAAAPPHPRASAGSAGERSGAQRRVGSIEYRVATAEASGLPDASVDLAVAAQAAHWFDWPAFVAEVGRVAKPGALIALVAYGNFTVDGVRDPDIAEYHDVTAGPYWPPERAHVETGYRDLVLPWPAVAIDPIAMTATWTCDELIGYLSSWSATARMIAARGPAAFDALCARLAAKWPAGKLAIEWPLVIKLARR